MNSLSTEIIRRVLSLAALSLGVLVGGALLGSRDGHVYLWSGIGLILAGGCLLAVTGFYLFGWL